MNCLPAISREALPIFEPVICGLDVLT